MAIVTGDRYLDYLVKFVDKQAGPLLDGSLVLKLNPVGLHYVQSRLEALQELEGLLSGAPVDYLRAYISDLGDHRALEQLRRILCLLTSLKVVSVLPPPIRDPTPLSLLPFGRLKFLELRGCDLSTSAAKGLLELRHTLEKIIVHNSTDALRHVFASRIVDIKDSPAWSKLSLVSCPCNGLVLMDESLQLLPSVETLDLSRNRFAKVDNLRKCTKLKHLDLGFNHLRSISSLSEVACSIVKLVLRNNALTRLHGIETFKLVEGLDLSYNIISNISELEILSSLPSLQSLWLEGNPICCIPWFRAQVFSFFAHPEKLKLDEKEITTRESWKRQIVLASRLKKPAGFGFYCPAKDNDEEEGSVNTNRKKPSRLASIEEDEQVICIFPEAIERDSVSCESSEIRSRPETAISDSEEIVDLMNRVEFMKKEHSVLWLREFQEWMDQNSENSVDNTKLSGFVGPSKEDSIENRKGSMQHGESSRYVSEIVSASGDGSTTNLFESDNSFGDGSIGLHGYQYFNSVNEVALESSIAECVGDSGPDIRTGEVSLEPVQPKLPFQAHFSSLPLVKDSHLPHTLRPHQYVKADAEVSCMPTIAIDEMIDSHVSSVYPSSPPHYEEDILHRRNNLEEEFMQLSVESYSLASSDSDTSTSDDAFSIFDTFSPEADQLLNEDSANRNLVDHSELHFSEDLSCGKRGETSDRQDGRPLFGSCTVQTSGVMEHLKADHICIGNKLADADVCTIDNADEQDDECLEKMRRKRRLRRRVVSLPEEKSAMGNTEPLSPKQNGVSEVLGEMEDETAGKNFNDFQKFYANNHINSHLTETNDSQSITDEVIKKYFHANIADSSVSETCLQCMLCSCMLQRGSKSRESEVIILLSSTNKVYVLLANTTSDGSGAVSEVIGCHRLDEIKEVVIGIGLQVLRVYVEMGANYLFMTKSLDRSRELLSLLCFCDSTPLSNRCLLRSGEKVQAELFEKHISRDSNVSIFLYSMLLFWCSNNEEEAWLSRSLFVIEGYMIVCVEDLVRFSFDTMDDASSSPYFSLDTCCSISDISEMVIEPRDSRCVTLTLDSEKLSPRLNLENEKMLTHLEEKMVTGSNKWKLKWFSEDILLKFVALLKALHAERAIYPLTVRCIS